MEDPGAKSGLVATLRAMIESGQPLDLQDWLGPLREFLARFAVADFECVMQPAPPTPAAVRTGLEGFDEAWSDFTEAFTDFRIRLDDVREAGDVVVSMATQIARTRHGGVEISQPSALLVEFERGRVTRIEFHIDREEALRRARLSRRP